jgi:hypothetical protein
LAKAKTKAAVKRKPAKTQARATLARAAKAAKKTTAAKSVKASAAKPTKAIAAKTAPSIVADVKVVAKPPVERKAGPLTLPAAAKPSVAPVANPAPVVRKTVASALQRADLPPADGFTLLVDGHFKNQFDDLKGAKAAATELKSRFPMLRVEIYDATKKARLPA